MNSEKEVINFLKRAGVSRRKESGRITLARIDHEVSFSVPFSVIRAIAKTLEGYPGDAVVDVHEEPKSVRFYTGPGEELKRRRLKAKLSQRELAEKLEIDRSNLVALENGRRRAGRSLALRIAAILGDCDYRLFM